MHLREFHSEYLNFERAVHHTRVIALTAAQYCHLFPRNLPSKLRSDIVLRIKRTLDSWEPESERAATSGRMMQGELSRSDAIDLSPNGSLAYHALCLLLTSASSERLTDDALWSEPGFTDFVHAQELVMLISHFEGFFAQTVRAICSRSPNTLRRNKTVSWSRVMDAGSYESLTRALADEYAYELSLLAVADRVIRLGEVHGVKINPPEAALAELNSAEQLRHIIVHNGSRVSAEYLKTTGRTDVQIGDAIPVAPESIERLALILRGISSNLFSAVAVKFFEATPDALHSLVFRFSWKGWEGVH